MAISTELEDEVFGASVLQTYRSSGTFKKFFDLLTLVHFSHFSSL
jgi:hypothetical protein